MFSDILNHLDFMNEMEIVLNLDNDELVEQFNLLSDTSKQTFLENCDKHFTELKEKYHLFLNSIKDNFIKESII